MELEDIRDILRFIRPYYSDKLLPLDLKNLLEEETNFGEFSRILVRTTVKKDEEAAKKIYKDVFPRNKYKKLKSSFVARTLNTVTFLDLWTPKLSDYTRAVFKCYKNLFVISSLLRLGSRNGAISLARKTLLLAEKYELHHVSVELLEQLRTHAVLKKNKTDFEKYVAKQKKELSALESETKVRILAQRLEILSVNSLYIDDTLESNAGKALKITEEEFKKHDTYMNRLTYYRLQNMYHQYAGNPTKSIAACDAALAYMKTKPALTPKLRIGEFYLNKIENNILIRDFNQGRQAASDCAEYIAKGTNTWFQYKEYHFLLLMQTMNFHDASIIYEEVVTHERFESQIELSERWQIIKLYLDYIQETEELRTKQAKQKVSYLLRQRRFRELTKRFPKASKDKQGYNVALLILNILLLLENNKKDMIIEKLEALSSYKFIHLKGKNSHESAILFRLIRLMVKYEFNYTVITKKSKNLEEKLRLAKPSLGEILNSVQIIPPSWIWARMKAALILLQDKEG